MYLEFSLVHLDLVLSMNLINLGQFLSSLLFSLERPSWCPSWFLLPFFRHFSTFHVFHVKILDFSLERLLESLVLSPSYFAHFSDFFLLYPVPFLERPSIFLVPFLARSS